MVDGDCNYNAKDWIVNYGWFAILPLFASIRVSGLKKGFFFQGNLELAEGRGGGVCVVERSLWGLTMSLCHFLCVHTDTLKAVGGIFSCYFVISSHPGRFSCNYVSILDDIGCPNVSSLDA